MQGISHASQSMGHAREGVCVPITTGLPEDGSKSCRRGGACGTQQESWEVGMQRGQLWCPVPVKGPSLGG